MMPMTSELLFFLQGLLKIGGGLGFTLGPSLGGLLYQVCTCNNIIPVQTLMPQLGGFKLPFLSIGVLASIFILPCALLVKGDTSEYPTDSSLHAVTPSSC